MITSKRHARFERIEKLLPLAGGGGGGGPIPLSGNVVGMSNANTVVEINNATVPTIGAIGTILQVTGVSSLSYGLVNLASSVTGILPAGNQAPQNLAGQATGTTAAVVIPLGGQLSGTPANATIQRAPLGPVRFIDPSNVSGLANDANSGATALLPILTTAHLNSLLFFRSLTGDVTITYMSDDPIGGLDLSTLDIGTFALTFQGTPQTLHTGGTLNAGTIAINHNANQRQVAHTSDLASFNPFVHTTFGGAAANPTRLIDNVTTSSAWIVTDATPVAPSLTQPVNPDGTIGTLTIGDAYRIVRGSILTLEDTSSPSFELNGQVTFNDFAFDLGSVGPNVGSGLHQGSSGFQPVAFNRCSFLDTANVSGSYSDCAFMFGASGNGTIFLAAGLYVSNSSTGEMNGSLALGGNCYVAQPTVNSIFECGGVLIANLFIFEQFGVASGGIQIQDSIADGISIRQGACLLGQALIWGSGNAGVGVIVGPAAAAAIGSSGLIPSVTGAMGDFAFRLAGNVKIQVARAWNDATGAYTEAGGPATRATTWANFTAAIGAGGFALNAHCVQGASSLVAD